MTSGKTQQVAVNVTDYNIRYKGKRWLPGPKDPGGMGNHGSPYKTWHGPAPGGGLSYIFYGTSVAVLGATDVGKTRRGSFDHPLDCFVDNIPISPCKGLRHSKDNQVLCEQHKLPDGVHELEVKFNPASQTYWFYGIRYTPSPSGRLIDNRDSEIVLSPGWHPLRISANMMRTVNSTATFDFTGTSVSWVGSFPHGSPPDASFATYSIDGGPQMHFDLSGPPRSDGSFTMFTTPKLPLGPHSLVVVYQGADQQTSLILDYLYITNTSTPVAPSVSPTSNSTTAGNSRNNLPIGAVVGGIVGGLMLIALGIFLLWWYKRWQRCEEAHREALENNSLPPVYSPSASDVSSPCYSHSDIFYNTRHSSSMSSTKVSSLEFYGYNLDTIAQAKALGKHQEMALPSVRLPALLHQGHGLGIEGDVGMVEKKTYSQSK